MLWVYFNLHRKNWSIMARHRVVGHADTLALDNATFRVREAGRLRVLATKRKNVHAFVCGRRSTAPSSEAAVRVSYNPYKAGHFYRCDTGAAISAADTVLFTRTQVF